MEESPWSCLDMSFSPDWVPRQQQQQPQSSQSRQRRLELLRRRFQIREQQLHLLRQHQQHSPQTLDSSLATSPSRSQPSFPLRHLDTTASPFAGLQLHGPGILPPLPSQDPSPFGRSSSPRNHAALPRLFPSSTAAKNVFLDAAPPTSTAIATSGTTTATTTTTTTTTTNAASTSARLPFRDIAPATNPSASTPPRRPSAHHLSSRPEPADDCIDNETLDLPVATPAPLPEYPSDHDLLLSLAETEFSSPSTYPPFTDPTFQRPAFSSISPLRQRQSPAQQGGALQPSSLSRATVNTSSSASASSASAAVTAAPSTSGISPAQPFSLHPRFLNQETPADRQHSSGRRFTRPSLSFDLTGLFPRSSQHNASPQATALPNDIFAPRNVDGLGEHLIATMPTRGHARDPPPPGTPTRDTRSGHKRRRLSSHSHSSQRPPRRSSRTAAAAAAASDESSLFIDDDDDDLFGESPAHSHSAGGRANAAAEEYATIDLTEATEVPEELKRPVVDKRIKLSKFQCVICMDDAKTLTLTHCGHMYCAKCLHSSLHAEPTRGKCPMCRAKIDMKPRDNYSSKTKGFWPLELKLMTATRKGKRKADGA